MNGKKTWIIPDGYMNPTKNGDFNSHEAICVLNLSGKDAHIDIKIFVRKMVSVIINAILYELIFYPFIVFCPLLIMGSSKKRSVHFKI